MTCILRSLLALCFLSAPVLAEQPTSVIFLHPDGAGIPHWQAARLVTVGPDGDLNWDKLPNIAVYRGHMKDSVTATSNGGATTHAYGVKVVSEGFGSDGGNSPPVSASGQTRSIMHEALEEGFRTALINSGSVIEPGTAAFVASVASRKEDSEEVARQVMDSGVDIILSGGEEWFLPEGVRGRHGLGRRQDGLNLIDKARALGYTIVYDAQELAAVPPETEKLLGIFAVGHTFHAQPEEELAAAGRLLYEPYAPTLDEMTKKALEMTHGKPFFYVIEEEGSDNFGNNNNALGTLEALRRTDEAIGSIVEFIDQNPNTLLITTADSEAGDMDVIGYEPGSRKAIMVEYGLDPNGAPFDVPEAGIPFLSAPNQDGNRFPFVVTWGTYQDTSGGILVRAAGKHANRVRGNMDNTEVYDVMYFALFNQKPGSRKRELAESAEATETIEVEPLD